MKTVTSDKESGVIDNIQAAIEQLGGKKGEHPPAGFQRVVDIRIEGPKNPLRVASREQLLSTLRGTINHLEYLTPTDATPGLIRIINAISTFLFTVNELR